MEIPQELIGALGEAGRVAVLTGAGISAESGVPTFREAQSGLWERFRPEELATPEAFRQNPQRVWDWYAWRRQMILDTQPNAGHRALARWEKLAKDFTLMTQNVDGLHRRAGSAEPIELHGNLFRTICERERVVVEEWDEGGERPPRCPRCGARLRPDVVWFGEALPREALEAAFAASGSCDVFLSVGTSSLVYPAADLPFQALQSDAVVVEVNPRATPLSEHAHFSLRGRAGEVLPALVDRLARGGGDSMRGEP